jgi:hypothetical protein
MAHYKCTSCGHQLGRKQILYESMTDKLKTDPKFKKLSPTEVDKLEMSIMQSLTPIDDYKPDNPRLFFCCPGKLLSYIDQAKLIKS